MAAKRRKQPKVQRVAVNADPVLYQMLQDAVPALAATGRAILPDVIAPVMEEIRRQGGRWRWPEPTPETGEVFIATLYLFQQVGRVVAREYVKATGADPDAISEAMNSSGLVYVGLDESGLPEGVITGFGFGPALPGATVPPSWADSPEVRPVIDALRWMRATKGREWSDLFGPYVIGAMWGVAKELRERAKPTGLGDRTVFPQPLVSAFRPPQFAQQADRLEQGDFFGVTPESREMLQKAKRTVTTRQLMRLAAPELRAFHAAYRAVSSFGDDGRAFTRASMSLPWATFCNAAGINRRQQGPQRALLTAARDLDRRVIYASIEAPDPEHPGKHLLVVGSCQVMKVVPVWGNLTPEESARTLAQYEALAPGETWSGPLPTLVGLEVPPLLDDTVSALALDGSVVKRLDDGSRAIRGKSHGLNPLDHALFLELTQRVQSQQVAALDNGGPSLWSYLYRDDFLADFYGPDAIAKAKRQRNYAKLEASYHQAVRALEAGGLVLKSELEYQGRKGGEKGRVQDRFALNPELVKGLGERAKRAIPDPHQLTLPAGTSRGRGRPRKSGR